MVKNMDKILIIIGFVFENNKGAQVVGAQLFNVNKEENGAGLQNSIYKHE